MADGLLNKASIILTPTGYKAGTLYNVAPVVEPYEDFDFARASVASRVNSSGLVEMVGRTLGSELVTNGDFATDSNWSGTGSNGISISDGKLNFNNTPYTRNSAQSNVTTVGKTYKVVFTVSDYVKGSVRIFLGGSATSTASANGTYAFYLTASSNTTIGVQVMDGSGTTLSVDNVSVKEIIDTNNIPRISYDSNGDNGHILLEPTSTNLLTYSEDFTDSSWTKSNVTITSNSIISPDGSLNASLMTISGGASDQRISSNISYSGTNTVSIFAKASNSNWLSIRIGSSVNKWYDLENGVLGGSTITTAYVDADIQDFGNGWYRCILVFTENNTLNTRIYPAENNLDVTHTSGSVYIWGCQAEALSYATSYIPTLMGSTETRATETANGAGSADLINSTEGVLYAEISAFENTDDAFAISLNDGSSTNRIFLTLRTPESEYRAFSTGGGDLTFQGLDVTNISKIAVRYSLNNFSLWVNGVKRRETLVYPGIPSNTLNNLSFDRDGAGELDFYGKVKSVAVFKEALSDSELTQLTT